MNLETYPIEEVEPLIFTFVSKGKKGDIFKIIRYDLMSEDVYNLGFGDLDLKTLDIDDTVNSDNGDIVRVMATVIQTLSLFFEIHPNKKVSFEGSDSKRTNFYNWIISREYPKLQNIYYLEGGFEDGTTEPFHKGGDYSYFLIAKIKRQ